MSMINVKSFSINFNLASINSFTFFTNYNQIVTWPRLWSFSYIKVFIKLIWKALANHETRWTCWQTWIWLNYCKFLLKAFLSFSRIYNTLNLCNQLCIYLNWFLSKDYVKLSKVAKNFRASTEFCTDFIKH